MAGINFLAKSVDLDQNIKKFIKKLKLFVVYICFSGAMITPIINSQLMETNFNVFKITVLLMQFIFFIAFIAMLFIGKKLVKPDPAQKDETSDIVSQAQPLNT